MLNHIMHEICQEKALSGPSQGTLAQDCRKGGATRSMRPAGHSWDICQESAGAGTAAARWSSGSGKVSWLVIAKGASTLVVKEGHLP